MWQNIKNEITAIDDESMYTGDLALNDVGKKSLREWNQMLKNLTPRNAKKFGYLMDKFYRVATTSDGHVGGSSPIIGIKLCRFDGFRPWSYKSFSWAVTSCGESQHCSKLMTSRVLGDDGFRFALALSKFSFSGDIQPVIESVNAVSDEIVDIIDLDICGGL